MRNLNQAHQDLIWYFNSSHTAFGLKSNFGASLIGVKTLDWEPSDADLDAVARERRVRRVLSRVPHDVQRILEAYCTIEEERCCPTLRVIYSEYLRVVRLQHTRDELLSIRTRKQHDELLADAKRSVKAALKAYKNAVKEASRDD